MRFLIMLEPMENGFGVQVPDLAVVTHGNTIEQTKRAAVEAIKINLDAYREAGQQVPKKKPLMEHLENPDFSDLLLVFVNVDIDHAGKLEAA